MPLRSRPRAYGVVAVVLHWLTAAAMVGLFALGWWMVDLTYYDAWYRRAPEVHKGIGILLALAMLVRLGWRLLDPAPTPEPGMGPVQRLVARGAHQLLYLLAFAVLLSGYLIPTADGRAVQVFGLFAVPATVTGLPEQADLAGKVHWYSALALMGLAALHTLAALKHHFIDRDRTLRKMLGLSD
jgi:cytochrome b561